jgi:hypothetical protein
MGRTNNNQRATARHGGAPLRTDAHLMRANPLTGRASSALLASGSLGGHTSIGCVEMECRAFVVGANR